MWFPNRSDTNWPVQSHKKARSLKFRIQGEDELYYLCSGNKGADLLCFRIGNNPFFLRRGSIMHSPCSEYATHFFFSFMKYVNIIKKKLEKTQMIIVLFIFGIKDKKMVSFYCICLCFSFFQHWNIF